jgi:hypothetical protein
MPIIFCAEKYLSATDPTKKGEMIVAIANALYVFPISAPDELSIFAMYVPAVTYHAPQIKY